MPGPVLTPPGFFGKLPAHGDFALRRLPRGFVALWDPWVACHLARRAAFPPLCFAHPGAITGPMNGPMTGPMTGVVVPSRDRAGRRFPLTLAAPGATAPGSWYAALIAAGEAAARGALDAEALAARLAALPPGAPGDPARLRLWRPETPAEADPGAVLAALPMIAEAR